MNINFNFRNPHKQQKNRVPDGKTARRMYEMQKAVDSKENKHNRHENIEYIVKKCAKKKNNNLMFNTHSLYKFNDPKDRTFPHVLIKIHV